VVRPEDLDSARIAVGEHYTLGALEWWVEERPIHAEVFDPEKLTTTVSLPAEVRELLTSGHTVRWGVVPAVGPPMTTTVRVRPLLPADQALLDRIDADVADSGFLRHLLRAQILANAGFLTGSLTEARRALAERPGEVHAASLALKVNAELCQHVYDDDGSWEVVRRATAARRTSRTRCRLDDVAAAAHVSSLGCDERRGCDGPASRPDTAPDPREP
jgi:hypothetical protein